MSTVHPEDPSDTPITEVVVRRDGEVIDRQLCESDREVASVIAHWEEHPGVSCEVVDLSASAGDAAPDLDWTDDVADYPAGPEPED